MIVLLALSPPPAEEVLRQVLRNLGSVRRLEGSITKSGRERAREPFIPAADLRFYYEAPNRVWVESAGYWGDYRRILSDGKTLRVDDDYGTITLSDANGMPSELVEPGGSPFSVLFLMLQGEKAWPQLVAAGSKIEVGTGVIRFQSPTFGAVTLRHDNLRVTGVDYDNYGNRLASYLVMPMWSEKPETPLDREAFDLIWEGPKHRFAVMPPKGVRFEDRRKKKGGD